MTEWELAITELAEFIYNSAPDVKTIKANINSFLQAGHWVQLDDDQRLPQDKECTRTRNCFAVIEERHACDTGYFAAQRDMLEAGWRKVKLEDEDFGKDIRSLSNPDGYEPNKPDADITRIATEVGEPKPDESRLLASEEIATMSQVFPEGFTGRVGLMIIKAQDAKTTRAMIEEIESFCPIIKDGMYGQIWQALKAKYQKREVPMADLREKIAKFYWLNKARMKADDFADGVIRLISAELEKLTVIGLEEIAQATEHTANYLGYATDLRGKLNRVAQAQLQHTIKQLEELLK